MDVGINNIDFEIDQPGITEMCNRSTQLIGPKDSEDTSSSSDRLSEKHDPPVSI